MMFERFPNSNVQINKLLVEVRITQIFNVPYRLLNCRRRVGLTEACVLKVTLNIFIINQFLRFIAC